MPRILWAGLCAALVVQGATSARAEPPSPLPYRAAIEVPVLSLGAAGWLSSEFLFKKQLAPTSCRWSEPNPLDLAVRQSLLWTNPRGADVASDVAGFALAPVGALGLLALAAYRDRASSQIPVDLLVALEAVVLSADLNQAVKFTVGRERPCIHALAADQKALSAEPSDNNLSFYSGHTNLAFALAVAAGTVASLHGYSLAPLVWGVGLTVATATGVLRIAADKHYLTDVLTGAVVGSAFGFGLPYLLHHP